MQDSLTTNNNDVTIWISSLCQIFNLHYFIQYHNNSGRSHVHLIDKSYGESLAIDPELEPEASKTLSAGLEICLKMVKQNYLNKTWTAINNSSLFSSITTWSLQFRIDQHLNHSSTWAISGTLRQCHHIQEASVSLSWKVHRGIFSRFLVLT